MLKDYRIVMIANLYYPTSTNQKDLKELVFRFKSEKLDYVLLCVGVSLMNIPLQKNEMKFLKY